MLKRTFFNISLFLLVLFLIPSMACEPEGGDQAEGVSACDAVAGRGTWEVPLNRESPIDSGKPISKMEVLGGAGVGFSNRGGQFTLNLQLEDANGDLLFENLTADQFSIDPDTPLQLLFGDGTKIPFSYRDLKTVGLDVKKPTGAGLTGVLLFDSSGSNSGTDPERIRVIAGQNFVDAIWPGTQLAVLDFGVAEGIFDSTVSECFDQCRFLSDFTDDKAVLKVEIARVTAAGGTPMYGALEDTFDLLEATSSRGASNPFVVVFTDGQASDFSEERAAALIARAQKINAPIHTVALNSGGISSDDNTVDLENLQALSSGTSGLALLTENAEDLVGHFSQLADLANSEVSVIGTFSLVIDPAIEAYRIYTLTGRVKAKVNGGEVTAPFRIFIDLTAKL